MSKKRDRENAEAMGEVSEAAKPPAKGKRASNRPAASVLPAAVDTTAIASPGDPISDAATAEASAPSETAITDDAPKAETFGVVAAAAVVYEEVEYARLISSPLNPRKKRNPETLPDLARSIAEKGLLQPLLCRPTHVPVDRPEALAKMGFTVEQREIAIGSRRHEAIGYAINEGWLPSDYKVAIRTRPMTDDELVIIAGVENFDRDDMDPLDEAELFAAIRPRITPLPGQRREAAIGALFHITERTVFRRLDLLKLSDEAKGELREGNLTLGDAYALADEATETQNALIEEARAAAAEQTSPSPNPIAIRKPYIDGGVYDGDEKLLGLVKPVERWLATLPDGKEVGVFDSRMAAMSTLRNYQPPPPRPDAECIAEARQVLKAYHDAVVLHGGMHSIVADLADRIEKIAVEMNGGDSFGMAADDGGDAQLAEALKAPAGQLPLWGQPGEFQVEISDGTLAGKIPVRIVTEGLFGIDDFGFEARAIDPEKPFISKTGYRCFIEAAGPDARAVAAKNDIRVWAISVIEGHLRIDAKGRVTKLRMKLVPLDEDARENLDDWISDERPGADLADIERSILGALVVHQSTLTETLAVALELPAQAVKDACCRLLARGAIVNDPDQKYGGWKLPRPKVTEPAEAE